MPFMCLSHAPAPAQTQPRRPLTCWPDPYAPAGYGTRGTGEVQAASKTHTLQISHNARAHIARKEHMIIADTQKRTAWK